MHSAHPVISELINAGLLLQEQAESIQEEHLTQGRPVKAIAIDLGFISEKDYLKATARLLNTQLLPHIETSPEMAQIIPADMARTYQTAPVQADHSSISVAVADWPAQAVIDDLSFALSRPVNMLVAPDEEVQRILLKLYGPDNQEALLSEIEAELELSDLGSDPEHAAHATPVIRFVNLILNQAVKDRASDIHFEPFEHEFKIRYRVDGTLYEMEPPPVSLALPIISRIKVISGLDIAESRLPQDGRIQLDMADRSIDFRVSTLPTQFGESVVLRVLDRSNVQLDIDHIGFPEDIQTKFIEDITKPNGIVVVTGPTGSGKTTTLYAALQHINRVENKILTAEDPVEYDVEGVIQLPIRETIGLTFASALRSFLRQDPDIIMVGEIRDLETARIAVQASLTGHLVFTTLHTNDAPGAITRLIDMEVQPYLIASTVEAVIGQRLLRTICPNCKEAYQPENRELALLERTENDVKGRPFYQGTGCDTCSGSGYSGRRAIFEYLRINDNLRQAIAEREPAMTLRNKAIESGMRTLREDGIRAIFDGYTTVKEVVQYT